MYTDHSVVGSEGTLKDKHITGTTASRLVCRCYIIRTIRIVNICSYSWCIDVNVLHSGKNSHLYLLLSACAHTTHAPIAMFCSWRSWGVIETHFPRRLRTFAGVSNCSREGRLRKLNLQIWFLEGSETNSITEDTKNYIFMFINSVAEGKKLRLYFWRW